MIIRSLVDGLQRGRSFALCGGPKTGRSSTLAQVRAAVQKRWARQPQAVKVVPVSVALRQVEAGGPRQLAVVLWQQLLDALADPRVAGPDARPAPPKINLARSPDPWTALEEATETLWHAMQGTSGWCQYALLFDDADILLGRRFESCVEPLADMLAATGDHTPVALLAASGRPLREHLFDEHAMLGNLRPLFLGALRDSEARQLVRTAMPDVEDSWIDSALQASGRHPFLLQRLLTAVGAAGPDADLGAAIDASTDDCLQLFEAIWHELDFGRGVTYRGAYAAPEHALMQLVIDFATGVSLQVAERELGIQPLKEYAELLEYLGVIERVLKGNDELLRPHFDMWNVWYSERIMR